MNEHCNLPVKEAVERVKAERARREAEDAQLRAQQQQMEQQRQANIDAQWAQRQDESADAPSEDAAQDQPKERQYNREFLCRFSVYRMTITCCILAPSQIRRAEGGARAGAVRIMPTVQPQRQPSPPQSPKEESAPRAAISQSSDDDDPYKVAAAPPTHMQMMYEEPPVEEAPPKFTEQQLPRYDVVPGDIDDGARSMLSLIQCIEKCAV